MGTYKNISMALAAASLLLGCNSGSSSNGPPAVESSSSAANNAGEVATVLDLMSMPCTATNAQQTMLVKATGDVYKCLVLSSAVAQGTWYPTVATQSELGECSAALTGKYYYVTDKADVYMCANAAWTGVGLNLISSSSNSTENPSSSANTSSSSDGSSVTPSSSATAVKVVTFEDGILWTPSYKKRARTFFNTVDEYNFWSPNLETKDSSGWWEKYSDAVDGGSSEVLGTFETDYLALSVVLNYTNWYKATDEMGYTYNAPDPYPYGGFQFPLSPVEGGYTDLSSWTGVCVTYTATEPFAFALRSALTDLGDGMHWEASVPAASSVTTVEVDFGALTRSPYAKTVVSRTAAIKKATGFQFAFRNDEADVECKATYASSCGSYGISNSIKLYKIGKSGTCGTSGGGNTL